MPASDLPPLFRSELQLRTLGLLFLNPDRGWTTNELTHALDATPVSVHRELHRALESRVLEREAVGRTYIYRVAEASPLFEPLRLLLERTVGVEPELRRALAGVSGVEAAFIHGSFATKTRIRPTSDIDVFVLGQAEPRLLRRRLRELEARLGRKIDLLAYTPDEFAALATSGNSIVRGIIRGPVIPLVGSRDALQVNVSRARARADRPT